MFRQIVVPLDGSEQAERALAVAARIARRANGTVTLVQVVGAEAARGSDAVPVHTGNRLLATQYLERMRQRPELAGVPTSVVVRDGDPTEQLGIAARRHGADLIVLSHRRHGPAAAFFAGSIADQLMRRSPVPVLALHAGAVTEFRDGQVGATRWPVQALVPLDGSPLAETAIPCALELLRALEDGHGVKLHLMYVLDPKQAYRSGIAETEAMHEARLYLESVTARIAADPVWRSIALTAKVEPDANVVLGIERVAEQGANLRGDTFDFVAMATHGREGMARWLAGSITEGLVHDIHVPVLIVHSQHEQTAVGSLREGGEVMEQAPRMPLF
jgi:nucleotide-binding universal stress UspA family protein